MYLNPSSFAIAGTLMSLPFAIATKIYMFINSLNVFYIIDCDSKFFIETFQGCALLILFAIISLILFATIFYLAFLIFAVTYNKLSNHLAQK